MNFRLTVQFEGDKPERTTLAEFLADNEAALDVCERVRALAPGESMTTGGGAAPAVTITRAAKTEQRFTHVRVPIDFDGAEYATITIDRKRLTLAVRPARRRSVFEVALREWAETMLERQSKLNVRARLKARRTRRNTR
jgi:hypothetical protein